MRRARSTREFAAKLQIVNEEIDEAGSWLSLLTDLADDPPSSLATALNEAHELRAIFARARATTRRRLSQ